MNTPELTVVHWRYDNGHREPPPLLKHAGWQDPEFIVESVGWHCHLVTNDGQEFTKWMTLHFPDIETIYRFNSGNPYIEVHFINREDAIFFMLHFGNGKGWTDGHDH